MVLGCVIRVARSSRLGGSVRVRRRLIHEVSALTRKKLTPAQAGSLTTQAENIQATLSC
jgi:hypothetical protein